VKLDQLEVSIDTLDREKFNQRRGLMVANDSESARLH